MPNRLHHNAEVTRSIACTDCKVELPWNDAVAAGWVLGTQSGDFRCKCCSDKFEAELSDIFAMRTPALRAWKAANAHLLNPVRNPYY